MRGAVMYAPRDVRVEERPDPQILKPTDAIIRLPATCICGSDLWPYRGFDEVNGPTPMGHEYVGIVEQVGTEVTTIKPGQFVIGSFFASDNTCEICQAGYQSSCVNRVGVGSEGAQAELMRVPLADGTLVATPDVPTDDLIPDFLALSDVLGTGWFGVVAAEAGPKPSSCRARLPTASGPPPERPARTSYLESTNANDTERRSTTRSCTSALMAG